MQINASHGLEAEEVGIRRVRKAAISGTQIFCDDVMKQINTTSLCPIPLASNMPNCVLQIRRWEGGGILIHKVFIWLVRVSSNQGGWGSFPPKRDADQTN